MRIFNTHLVSSNPFDSGGTLAAPHQITPMVIASGTLSGSFSSPPLNLQHIYGYSVDVTTIGVTGSVGLYASNEAGQEYPGDNGQSIVNWTLVPTTVQQFSSSQVTKTTGTWNVSQVFYKWLRAQYVHTAGTGSIDVWATGKGDSE